MPEKVEVCSRIRGKNLTGEIFGRLKVVSFTGHRRTPKGVPKKLWTCVCQCGATKVIDHVSLTHHLVQSCGCLKKELCITRSTKHGFAKHPIYSQWCAMKKRCLNPKDSKWKDYGGRGIELCKRWHAFVAFKEDMLPSWSSGMTIERKDSNGNYEPNNVRWATRLEQSNNTRRNVFVTCNGKTMTVSQFGREFGFSVNRISCIYGRLERGLSNEDVLRGFIMDADCQPDRSSRGDQPTEKTVSVESGKKCASAYDSNLQLHLDI